MMHESQDSAHKTYALSYDGEKQSCRVMRTNNWCYFYAFFIHGMVNGFSEEEAIFEGLSETILTGIKNYREKLIKLPWNMPSCISVVNVADKFVEKAADLTEQEIDNLNKKSSKDSEMVTSALKNRRMMEEELMEHEKNVLQIEQDEEIGGENIQNNTPLEKGTKETPKKTKFVGPPLSYGKMRDLQRKCPALKNKFVHSDCESDLCKFCEKFPELVFALCKMEKEQETSNSELLTQQIEAMRNQVLLGAIHKYDCRIWRKKRRGQDKNITEEEIFFICDWIANWKLVLERQLGQAFYFALNLAIFVMCVAYRNEDSTIGKTNIVVVTQLMRKDGLMTTAIINKVLKMDVFQNKKILTINSDGATHFNNETAFGLYHQIVSFTDFCKTKSDLEIRFENLKRIQPMIGLPLFEKITVEKNPPYHGKDDPDRAGNVVKNDLTTFVQKNLHPEIQITDSASAVEALKLVQEEKIKMRQTTGGKAPVPSIYVEMTEEDLVQFSMENNQKRIQEETEKLKEEFENNYHLLSKQQQKQLGVVFETEDDIEDEMEDDVDVSNKPNKQSSPVTPIQLTKRTRKVPIHFQGFNLETSPITGKEMQWEEDDEGDDGEFIDEEETEFEAEIVKEKKKQGKKGGKAKTRKSLTEMTLGRNEKTKKDDEEQGKDFVIPNCKFNTNVLRYIPSKQFRLPSSVLDDGYSPSKGGLFGCIVEARTHYHGIFKPIRTEYSDKTTSINIKMKKSVNPKVDIAPTFPATFTRQMMSLNSVDNPDQVSLFGKPKKGKKRNLEEEKEEKQDEIMEGPILSQDAMDLVKKNFRAYNTRVEPQILNGLLLPKTGKELEGYNFRNGAHLLTVVAQQNLVNFDSWIPKKLNSEDSEETKKEIIVQILQDFKEDEILKFGQLEISIPLMLSGEICEVVSSENFYSILDSIERMTKNTSLFVIIDLKIDGESNNAIVWLKNSKPTIIIVHENWFQTLSNSPCFIALRQIISLPKQFTSPLSGFHPDMSSLSFIYCHNLLGSNWSQNPEYIVQTIFEKYLNPSNQQPSPFEEVYSTIIELFSNNEELDELQIVFILSIISLESKNVTNVYKFRELVEENKEDVQNFLNSGNTILSTFEFIDSQGQMKNGVIRMHGKLCEYFFDSTKERFSEDKELALEGLYEIQSANMEFIPSAFANNGDLASSHCSILMMAKETEFIDCSSESIGVEELISRFLQVLTTSLKHTNVQFTQKDFRAQATQKSVERAIAESNMEAQIGEKVIQHAAVERRDQDHANNEFFEPLNNSEAQIGDEDADIIEDFENFLREEDQNEVALEFVRKIHEKYPEKQSGKSEYDSNEEPIRKQVLLDAFSEVSQDVIDQEAIEDEETMLTKEEMKATMQNTSSLLREPKKYKKLQRFQQRNYLEISKNNAAFVFSSAEIDFNQINEEFGEISIENEKLENKKRKLYNLEEEEEIESPKKKKKTARNRKETKNLEVESPKKNKKMESKNKKRKEKEDSGKQEEKSNKRHKK